MRRSALALVVPALAALAAGCGTATSGSQPGHPPGTAPTTTTATTAAAPATVKVESRVLPHLGRVLVDASGRTLYIFLPDRQKRVTCTASCQDVWPPLAAPSSGKAVAVPPVKSSLLGSDPNLNGGRVVTYNGWPLYTFVPDSGPGTAYGQAKYLNGGVWFVISPSGQPVTSNQPPTSASSTTSTAPKARAGAKPRSRKVKSKVRTSGKR
jgi:predicted lipoprotein with Yx(FWY)xxD motif